METNIDGRSTWSRLVAQWQPAVLVTACVAGGLTLTMMVIGSTPDVVVQASQAALEAAPVDAPDAPVVSEVPVDTALSSDSTEVVDPAAAEAAAAAQGTASAALLDPATMAPAAGPAPAGPAPTAAPSAGTPSAPAPAPVVTAAPVTPGAVAAPQATVAPTTTALPTTAAPTPTTAAPPPTTAAPPPTTAAPPPTTAAPTTAALTYPSFSAGSAATVVLQFDGSSIYVASVNRQANWVSQVDKNGPRTVEIKFFNTATQRDEEFHATVENGRIKVEN